jgi:hypothetical protein
MSNIKKLAIALAMTAVTVTGALAASHKPASVHPRVYDAYAGTRAPDYRPPSASPYFWSSEEESRLDHARGYIGGN